MASGLGIEGRSKMGKEELVKTLQKKMRLRGGSATSMQKYLVYGTEIVKPIIKIQEMANGQVRIETKEGIKVIPREKVVIYGNYVAVKM